MNKDRGVLAPSNDNVAKKEKHSLFVTIFCGLGLGAFLYGFSKALTILYASLSVLPMRSIGFN